VPGAGIVSAAMSAGGGAKGRKVGGGPLGGGGARRGGDRLGEGGQGGTSGAGGVFGRVCSMLRWVIVCVDVDVEDEMTATREGDGGRG
jgi:hypothetical protein